MRTNPPALIDHACTRREVHGDVGAQPKDARDLATQARADFDQLFAGINQRLANERIIRRARQRGLVNTPPQTE